jgi:hypothetical protein
MLTHVCQVLKRWGDVYQMTLTLQESVFALVRCDVDGQRGDGSVEELLVR